MVLASLVDVLADAGDHGVAFLCGDRIDDGCHLKGCDLSTGTIVALLLLDAATENDGLVENGE